MLIQCGVRQVGERSAVPAGLRHLHHARPGVLRGHRHFVERVHRRAPL